MDHLDYYLVDFSYTSTTPSWKVVLPSKTSKCWGDEWSDVGWKTPNKITAIFPFLILLNEMGVSCWVIYLMRAICSKSKPLNRIGGNSWSEESLYTSKRWSVTMGCDMSLGSVDGHIFRISVVNGRCHHMFRESWQHLSTYPSRIIWKIWRRQLLFWRIFLVVKSSQKLELRDGGAGYIFVTQ